MEKRIQIVLVFLSVLISGVNFSLHAQYDPPVRIEIDVKSDKAGYKILPCGGSGFYVFYETTVFEEEKKYWAFVLYDRFLNEKQKIDIPFLPKMEFKADHFIFPNQYLLFCDQDKKKGNYNFQLLKLNITSGKHEIFSGDLPDRSYIRDFKVLDEKVYIGHYNEKKSGITTVNTLSREKNALFVNGSFSSEVESLFMDTLHKSVWAIFNNFESKTSFYLSIYEFGFDDQVKKEFTLNTPDGKKFNTATITSVSKNNHLIIGTYDNIKGRNSDLKNYFSNEATGFFTTNIIDNIIDSAAFHNFIDFENLTAYLKAEEFRNVKKKATKKGTENLSLEYDLLIHEIIVMDSHYYFLAEGYYEEYHTVTNTYYDYYGRPMPMSYSVFDGYRYFNAFLSCFSGSGEKIWDNGLEIFNILTLDLKKMVSIYNENDDIILSYNHEGKVASKILNNGDVIEGVEYYPLEGLYANDRIMDDSKSFMEHWYNNYFLCYGFQTIRNNSFSENDKRTIFYINKLVFR
ncbi:MAG: hypothetical protein K8R53_05660 [Bacteroidales bacterium]|nr:hypothetical protein [Bacteroidales bacterium]